MKKTKRIKYETFDSFHNDYRQDLIKYVKRVLGYLSFYAEDVVQHSFCTISQKDQWKLSYAKFLLFKVAKNKAIDILRREKSHVDIFDIDHMLPARELDICRNIELEEYKKHCDELAHTYLSALQYKVYSFIVHKSMNVEEMSDELGKTPKVIRVHRCQVIKKLQKHLESHKNKNRF